MLLFFAIIVVGLFLDRYIQLKSFERLEGHKANIPLDSKKDDKKEITENENDIMLARFHKKLKLADNIAIVSPKLREESYIKIIRFLIHKIDLHPFVFSYPNPSSIIPINDKYFGRFSWNEEMITCHELFEVPEDTDMDIWKQWTEMQENYIYLYASPHRLPGAIPEEKKLINFTEDIREIIKSAEYILEKSIEKSHSGTKILISKVLSIINNIDLNDRSKTSKNAVVQLEIALSTIHDIIKRLMPRVISI